MSSNATISDMRLLLLAVALMIIGQSVLTSCREEEKSYVKNIGNGERTPTMNTLDVHTFISDSGYTKYYITSPLWSMYEEAQDPFWLFPKGIDLEQYDEKLKVTATMRCDSAKYLSQKHLWRLDGNVVMVNTQRDTFLTKQLYWDQAKREIYTDSFIHIVKDKRVIEGIGFTSNENMTAYTVKRPMGIFPVEGKPGGSSQTSSNPEDDALHESENYRGYAPPPASERSYRTGIKPIEHDTIPKSMQTARPGPKTSQKNK